MSEFAFRAYGHENIRGTHASTLEFTKEAELTLTGDCIIGVKADFDAEKLRAFVMEKKKAGDLTLRMVLRVGDLEEIVEGKLNILFNDRHEVVARRTDFASGRTLMLRADKGAAQLSKDFLKAMRTPGREIRVVFR